VLEFVFKQREVGIIGLYLGGAGLKHWRGQMLTWLSPSFQLISDCV